MKTKKLTHTTITTVAVLGTTAERDTRTGLWRWTLSQGPPGPDLLRRRRTLRLTPGGQDKGYRSTAQARDQGQGPVRPAVL